MLDRVPQVLRPFHRNEAITIADGARIAARSARTIRDWCQLHDLGRRIGGRWAVSKVALAMWLDGDKQGLAAYLAGDRSSGLVTIYFERCGVPLPDCNGRFREQQLSELNSPSGAVP
jgi:hypothetical protein